MSKDVTPEAEIPTEIRIKEAAQKVFIQKGYSGTRTRDIAEEAGINLAMLNYYFRSKEKLFQIVMEENLQLLFGDAEPIINDEATSLEEKLQSLIAFYLNLFSTHPELPLFVLGEMKHHPEYFENGAPAGKMFEDSVFYQQLKKDLAQMDVRQFLTNVMSLCFFPYIAKRLVSKAGLVPEDQFDEMAEARKRLVPIWASMLLQNAQTQLQDTSSDLKQ